MLPRIHSPNTAGHLHILITLGFPPTPHSNLIFLLRQSSCLSHILHSLANPMFSTRQDFLFRDKTHYHSPVIDSPVDKYSYLGMAVSIRLLELQKIPKYSCLSMPIAGEHQSIHIQGALCALCSLVIMVYKL